MRSHRRVLPIRLRGFPVSADGPGPDAVAAAEEKTCRYEMATRRHEMTDKRPIVFATDGSPSAADAQKMALELAQELDAPLLVVSVAHPAYPAGSYAGYGYANIVTELMEAEHTRVHELLAVIAQIAEAEHVRCTTVEANGSAVDEICLHAGESNAQLIVVGSHGWGAARRLFSGSVSTGLVHSAPCPVLVVRSSRPVEEHAVAA
jgi:nucleotide-binding universal stress UspA family protein